MILEIQRQRIETAPGDDIVDERRRRGPIVNSDWPGVGGVNVQQGRKIAVAECFRGHGGVLGKALSQPHGIVAGKEESPVFPHRAADGGAKSVAIILRQAVGELFAGVQLRVAQELILFRRIMAAD